MGLSTRLRDFGQLFILPAVLVPAWLLAVASFSTIGLLPLGTLLIATASIAFVKSLCRRNSENALLAEIGSKLITYCAVMIVVSALFLALQVGIYLFLTQFSPTLETLVAWYNNLEAKPIFGFLEALTLKVRIAVIFAIIINLVFFPLLSPQAVRLSKLTSKLIDVVGAVAVAFLLFVFYGSSPSGLNAIRIELRSSQQSLERSYRQAVDQAALQITKAVLDQSIAHNNKLLQPPTDLPGNLRPPGGDIPNGPGPQDRGPGLGVWDSEVAARISRQGERTTRTEIEKVKSSIRSAQPLQDNRSISPPPTTSNARIESFERAIGEAQSDTHPGDVLPQNGAADRRLAAREMIGVALDSAKFSEIVEPAVSELVKETISGEVIREVLKPLSGDVLADAVRATATELVDGFLTGVIGSAGVKSEITKRASAILDSNVGRAFKTTIDNIRGYSVAIKERIRSFRSKGGDPLISETEKYMVADVQSQISKLENFPEGTDTSGEISKRSELETNKIVKALTAVAPTDDAVATALNQARASMEGRDISSKAQQLNTLIDLARRFGYSGSDIGVCTILRNRVPIASFISTRAQCEGARRRF